MRRRAIHSALGGDYPTGSEQITLFVPDKNRDGQDIDQDHWTNEALAVLAHLFRGATAFPPGKGVWRDDSRGGILLQELTVIVVSYAPKTNLGRSLEALRRFLHQFGRATNQGEVGVVISGSYYGISNYDAPERLT